MLIVCKTDGGSTYLENEVDVLLVVAGKKRVTNAESVLMAGYTAQGIFLTVKDEAVFGIDLEASYTETSRNTVDSLTVSYDRSLSRVEIRIASTVPEVYVINIKFYLCVSALKLCNNIFL